MADYVNPAGNMAWVELEQRINGIPVFQGQIRGGFTAKGELVRTTGLLVAGSAAPALEKPAIDGPQAVALAAERLNLAITTADLSEKASDADGTSVTFNATAAAADIKAWQVYFPLPDGQLRLAWIAQIMSSPDAFMTIIDGETGATLFRKNLTNYQTQAATYNVYTTESPAPAAPTPALPGANFQAPLVARQSVTLIGNEAPNTFNNLGWMTDGANSTNGNNVEAGIDVDGVNGVDAPVGGTSRVFNFAYNPSPGSPAPGDAPSLAAFRNGEVTNVFYWTNRFHDELYRQGFTEAARNFQNDNF
ncbi:MAG: M36 family metallopeptidase, partial [Acidobacteriota bacterium]